MNLVFLDVAIGLGTIFFLVATFCAGVQELLAGYLNLRGKTLWEGIQSILIAGDLRLGSSPRQDVVAADDPGNRIAQDLLEHPLIRGQVPDKFGVLDLFRWLRGDRVPTADSGSTKPSYLQSATFAVTLLDTIRKTYKNSDALLAATSLEQAITNMPTSELKTTLQAFVTKAEGDMEKVHQSIEAWFNEAMDRVSGWYKRRTQALLFLIGLVAAITFNIDSIQIFKQLWREPTMREMMVKQAEGVSIPATQENEVPGVDLVEQSQKMLNTLPPSLPIGWPAAAWSEKPLVNKTPLQTLCDVVLLVIGWLITASAATMGAPFWFDLISTLLPLRSGGKPAGKSKKSGKSEKSDKSSKSAQADAPAKED